MDSKIYAAAWAQHNQSSKCHGFPTILYNGKTRFCLLYSSAAALKSSSEFSFSCIASMSSYIHILFKYIASIPCFFASILNSFSIFNSTFPFLQIIYQTLSTTCFARVYSS
mgnify:CR=1 FL=1